MNPLEIQRSVRRRLGVNIDHVEASDFLQHDYSEGSLLGGTPNATCGATPNCKGGRTSWGALLPAGTPTFDHMNELFTTGQTADNNLQVSGGSDRTPAA